MEQPPPGPERRSFVANAMARLSVHMPHPESLLSSLASSSPYFMGDSNNAPATRAARAANRRTTLWIPADALDEEDPSVPSSAYTRDTYPSMDKFPLQDTGSKRDAPGNPWHDRYNEHRASFVPWVETPTDQKTSPPEYPFPGETVEAKARAPQEDLTEYPKGIKLALIILALCLAVLIMSLDNSIIATAIPQITKDFESLEDVGWYGSAYMLTSAGLQLFFGKIYTFLSIKWVFLAIVMIFEVGSLVCAIAQNSVMLIVGRAIAGLGAAGIFAGALTILAYTVPLEKRPIYTGLVGGMFGISAVAGPVLGGIFTDKASWRWCFYINLPIGAITLAVIAIFFHDPERNIEPRTLKQRFWQMDPIGTVIFMPSIICILLALQWGGTKYAWNDARITSLFMLFGFLMIIYIYIQYRMGDDATVPPRIIKKRSVWASNLFEFFLGAAFLETVYFLPIWFQAVQGTSAIDSGIRNIPFLFGEVLCSVLAGVVVSWKGHYVPFMILGAILMPIGFGLLSTLGTEASTAKWMLYQVIGGAGVGISMQQPLIAVQVVLDLADVSTGTAMIIFHQALGGALFVSAGHTIFGTELDKGLREHAAGINPQTVINLGATGFRDAVNSEFVTGIVQAYGDALGKCFYLATATACCTIFGALLMEWKTVKTNKPPKEKQADPEENRI